MLPTTHLFSINPLGNCLYYEPWLPDRYLLTGNRHGKKWPHSIVLPSVGGRYATLEIQSAQSSLDTVQAFDVRTLINDATLFACLNQQGQRVPFHTATTSHSWSTMRMDCPDILGLRPHLPLNSQRSIVLLALGTLENAQAQFGPAAVNATVTTMIAGAWKSIGSFSTQLTKRPSQPSQPWPQPSITIPVL